MKLALLSPLVLALPLAALAPRAAQLPQPGSPCPNALPRELFVSYEVTGGTFQGPVDLHLTVFSDGSARLSSAPGSSSGILYRTEVGEAAARALRDDLVAAGALRHCDYQLIVNDVPLSTLTVLRGPSRQVGNSFSWFGADPEIAEISAILQDFLAAHFPGLPGGGGQTR